MISNPEFDAYQRFVLSAKIYWTGPMFRALKSRYEQKLCVTPKQQPAGYERVAELLRDEPDAQIFGWMERHLQRLKYSGRLGLVPAHAAERERIETGLNVPLPPGLLELDPNFVQPKYYSSVDIHQHRGGVWSDKIAGKVYERGARSTTPMLSKDKDLHHRFTDIVVAKKQPKRLGPVENHRELISAEPRYIMAAKLVSVLQLRMATRLNSFNLPKKFSMRCRHL